MTECLDDLIARMEAARGAPSPREIVLAVELAEAAGRVMDLPPEQWPPLHFNWDLTQEAQHFALDSESPEGFQSSYPQGLRYGWVSMTEFERVLAAYSRRTGPEEVWGLGSSSKLARAIAHLARGLPMTPPMVKPFEDRELLMLGGHHRYTAAKYSGEVNLVIGTPSDSVPAVAQLLPVSWID